MTILVHSSDLGREETPPRVREDLRQRRPRAATTTEFGAVLAAINLPQNRLAKLLGVTPRHVRRWRHGDRNVPPAVGILLRLVAAGLVTIDQAERAAVPVRTNGGAEPEPPAPLRVVKPTPTPAPTPALTPTDPDLTTAQKVWALTERACRWPCGDPGHSDFYFCGSPVAERSYCEHHSTMAYIASPTRSSPFRFSAKRY